MLSTISRRLGKRPKEPPLKHRDLWRALKECELSDIPDVIAKKFDAQALYSTKGEMGAWTQIISRCEDWLRKWLDGHSRKIDFTKAFIDEHPRDVTIPDAVGDEGVLLILRFLGWLLEHTRNRALFTAAHTVALFVNSPNVIVVKEALIVLHWYSTAYRQRHQTVPLEKPDVHKLVSIAAGWGVNPTLPQSCGLEPITEPLNIDSVSCSFFPVSYQSTAAGLRSGATQAASWYTTTTSSSSSNSAAAAASSTSSSSASSSAVAASPSSSTSAVPQHVENAAKWFSSSTSPSGRVTVTIHLPMEGTSHDAGPMWQRMRSTTEKVTSECALPYQHAYPLWTRLRMAVDMQSPEKLQQWAICRMLSLEVLSGVSEDVLRPFLQQCADWFQDVTKALSNPNAPCAVLSVVLQLISSLLSNTSARDALNNADLRGSALSHTTLAASNGRLLEMLHRAPKDMASPERHTPSGELREDAQDMFTALAGFASVFSINQNQGSSRVLNTAIIAPFLEISKLRIPGSEKVAVRCLSVLESLLQQDSLKVQVVEAGGTTLLLELLDEEVKAVDLSEKPMHVDVEDTLDATIKNKFASMEDRAEALRLKLDRLRRLHSSRENVLIHILRAVTLCIGTVQPKVLFASPHFAQSVKSILQHPQAFGHYVYKLAVHSLVTIINSDHTVCPAVIDGGFLDLVIATVKKSPDDPRYLVMLPQLLVAFCLSKKGTECVQDANIFPDLFRPLSSDDTWFTLTPHDALSLGGDLNDLIRSVWPLQDECTNALFKGIKNAASDVCNWVPPTVEEECDAKPLHVLQHHILLLEPLLRTSFDRLLRGGHTTTLLHAAEVLSNILHRPNVALGKSGLPPKLLPTCVDLKNDLLSILATCARAPTAKDLWDEIQFQVKNYPALCLDVDKWEEPSAPPTRPLVKVTVMVTPWPVEEGGAPLALHSVATIAHLLHLVNGLDGRSEHVDKVQVPSHEVLERLWTLMITVRKWLVQQKVQSEVAQQKSDRAHTHTFTEGGSGSTSRSISPSHSERSRPRTSELRGVASAATAAVLCATAVALEHDDGRDPKYCRRERVANMLIDTCHTFVDTLCRSVSRREALSNRSALLAQLAMLLVGAAQDAMESMPVPSNGQPEADIGRAIFSDLMLGTSGAKIMNLFSDSGNSRRETCRYHVLEEFDQIGGLEKLCRACTSMVRRSLDSGPTAGDEAELEDEWEGNPKGTGVCALRLLEKISNSFFLTDNNKRINTRVVDMVRKIQRLVATSLCEVWKHPMLHTKPAIAVRMLEIVGQLLTQYELRNPSAPDEEKSKIKKKSAPEFKVDEDTLNQLCEMGFNRALAGRAIVAVGRNEVSLATEWLLTHPEEANETEGGDAGDEIARAIALSLQGTEADQEQRDREEQAAKEKAAAEEAAKKEWESDPVRLLMAEAAEWALGLGCQSGAIAFCAADILCLLGEKDPSKCPGIVSDLWFIIEDMLDEGPLDAAKRNILSQRIKQLSLLLFHPSMKSLKVDMVKIPAVCEKLAALLESLQKVPPVDTDEHGEHIRLLSSLLGLLDSLTLPLGEGYTDTSKLGSFVRKTAGDGSPKTPPAEEPRPWDILLKAPNDPTLPPEALSGKILAAAIPLFQAGLPSKPMLQLLAIFTRLTKHYTLAHKLATGDHITKLLQTPIAGFVPTQAHASCVSAIIRNIIEDPQYTQLHLEGAIRTAYNKILTDTSRTDCTVTIPVSALEGSRGEEEKKRRKGTGKKGDEKKEADESGDKDGKVTLVKLQALLSVVEQQKRKNPAAFLSAITNVCSIVRCKTAKGGDKHSLLVEMRKDRRKGGGKQKKPTSQTADEVLSVLLKHYIRRFTGEAKEGAEEAFLLSMPQVLRIIADIASLYPSTANVFFSTKLPDNTPVLKLLLTKLLAYPASPTPQDARSEEIQEALRSVEAAKLLVQQLGLQKPEEVAPEVTSALGKMAANRNPLGTIHALSDFLATVLNRAVKGKRGSRHSNFSEKLIGAGLTTTVGNVLKEVDLCHPDVVETLCSMLQVIVLVKSQMEQMSKQESDKPAEAPSQPNDTGAVDKEEDMEGEDSMLMSLDAMDMGGEEQTVQIGVEEIGDVVEYDPNEEHEMEEDFEEITYTEGVDGGNGMLEGSDEDSAEEEEEEAYNTDEEMDLVEEQMETLVGVDMMTRMSRLVNLRNPSHQTVMTLVRETGLLSDHGEGEFIYRLSRGPGPRTQATITRTAAVPAASEHDPSSPATTINAPASYTPVALRHNTGGRRGERLIGITPMIPAIPPSSVLSYSADAIETAFDSYVQANAPESVVEATLPAEDDQPPVPQPVTSPTTPPTTAPAEASPPPSEPAEAPSAPPREEPAAPEQPPVPSEPAAAVVEEPRREETPAEPVPEPPAAAPTDVMSEQLSRAISDAVGAVTEADLLAEELGRALALSLEASGDVPAPAQDGAPAASEGESLMSLLSSGLRQGPDAPPAESPNAGAQPPTDTPAGESQPAGQPESAPALDPTFLAALPEEIRSEVLRENMHLLMTREQPGEDGSTIDPVFLSALPSAIRHEVLQHEQQIMAQRAARDASGGAPEEMDNASFIATLNPTLRQEILSSSDNSFLATLPPDIAAEAYALRERRYGERERMIARLQGRDAPQQGVQQKPAAPLKKFVVPPLKKADGPQVLDPSVLPALLRIMYISHSRPHTSGQLKLHFDQALAAVCEHPPTCQLICSLLLYILANGDAAMEPSSCPDAYSCIVSTMFGPQTYLASTTPVPPLKVPPLVLHRAIEALSSIASKHSACVTLPPAEAGEVLQSSDVAACIAVVKKSILHKLLDILQYPVYSSSPKLGEKLVQLVSSITEHLIQLISNDITSQSSQIHNELSRARFQEIEEWITPREQTLMTAFDVDAEDKTEGATKQLQEAFNSRKIFEASHGTFIHRLYWKKLAEGRRREESVQPTLVQRFGATLFSYPPTLAALVCVLESAETTPGAVAHCLSVITNACRMKPSWAPSMTQAGETIAQRLLRELLEAAQRIGVKTAEHLRSSTSRIREAFEAHLKLHGLDPAGGEAAHKDHTLPQPVAHFFLLDESSPHEVQLQRLIQTIAAVMRNQQRQMEENDLLTVDDEEVADLTDTSTMQGKWRTSAGNIVHVQDNLSAFERRDGTLCCGHELTKDSSGSLTLLGAKITRRTKSRVMWSDGDYWIRADKKLNLPMYESFRHALEPLWAAIGDYLSAVGGVLKVYSKSGFQVPLRVLPLVEAFFAFHEVDPARPPINQPLIPAVCTPFLAGVVGPRAKSDHAQGAAVAASRQRTGMGVTRASSAASLPDEEHREEDHVSAFIKSHQRLLNALLRSNSSLLSGPLKTLMGYSKFVDFHNKRVWFREQIQEDQESNASTQTVIKVSHQNVFEDSFLQLRPRSPDQLKGKLRVIFKGEEGVDGGGLTREWFQVLAKEMFNPGYALFIPSEEGNTFQPNPHSNINSEHLSYFHFVGRVVGLAIYNDVLLDAYFTRSLYKHMLGLPPSYLDIQSIDQRYFKSLEWMLENSVNGMDYTFSIDMDKFGTIELVDLKENGREIPVTDSNKHEYIQLIAEHWVTTSIKQQLTEFLKGFFEIVPRHLIQIFSPEELELLSCGTPDIDINDLKANVDYVGYSVSSPQISWLWKVVEEMTREEQLMLLQFVTGTSKVPLNGFKDLEGMSGKQKFNIHRTGDPSKLPTSHTCFNQLDLPEYESYESLRDKLRTAVLMGSIGFGFI